MSVERELFEKGVAIKEAEMARSEDSYFEARPRVDTDHNRHIFRAGFERGWNDAVDTALTAAPTAPAEQREADLIGWAVMKNGEMLEITDCENEAQEGADECGGTVFLLYTAMPGQPAGAEVES